MMSCPATPGLGSWRVTSEGCPEGNPYIVDPPFLGVHILEDPLPLIAPHLRFPGTSFWGHFLGHFWTSRDHFLGSLFSPTRHFWGAREVRISTFGDPDRSLLGPRRSRIGRFGVPDRSLLGPPRSQIRHFWGPETSQVQIWDSRWDPAKSGDVPSSEPVKRVFKRVPKGRFEGPHPQNRLFVRMGTPETRI